MLKGGEVDAFGVWEPSVELGIRGVGGGKVGVWKNGGFFFTYTLLWGEDLRRGGGGEGWER